MLIIIFYLKSTGVLFYRGNLSLVQKIVHYLRNVCVYNKMFVGDLLVHLRICFSFPFLFHKLSHDNWKQKEIHFTFVISGPELACGWSNSYYCLYSVCLNMLSSATSLVGILHASYICKTRHIHIDSQRWF